MKYSEFKKKYQKYPYLAVKAILNEVDNPQSMRVQMRRWEKKGLLIRLRKGMYIFNGEDYLGSGQGIDLRYLAGQIYSPSYISMEYALYFYGLIPESVEDNHFSNDSKNHALSKQIRSLHFSAY